MIGGRWKKGKPLARSVAGTAIATSGETAAERFAQSYRELFPPLYGYILFRVGDGHVAEDITAHVFERALSHLATIRQPDRIRPWLFAIARHAVAEYRRKHRPTTDLDAAEALAHLRIESPEMDAERRDEWRRAVTYLTELTEREREVIGLKFIAGLSYREIGQVCGVSEANAGQIAHRAIAKLRQRFAAEEGA